MKYIRANNVSRLVTKAIEKEASRILVAPPDESVIIVQEKPNARRQFFSHLQTSVSSNALSIAAACRVLREGGEKGGQSGQSDPGDADMVVRPGR